MNPQALQASSLCSRPSWPPPTFPFPLAPRSCLLPCKWGDICISSDKQDKEEVIQYWVKKKRDQSGVKEAI